MSNNALYYGDNLEVMRKYLPDASVDLVYLDPPFNSNRDYNLLFREQSGEPAQGQIKAFTDTWQWSERAYDAFCHTCPVPALVELYQSSRHSSLITRQALQRLPYPIPTNQTRPTAQRTR